MCLGKKQPDQINKEGAEWDDHRLFCVAFVVTVVAISNIWPTVTYWSCIYSHSLLYHSIRAHIFAKMPSLSWPVWWQHVGNMFVGNTDCIRISFMENNKTNLAEIQKQGCIWEGHRLIIVLPLCCHFCCHKLKATWFRLVNRFYGNNWTNVAEIQQLKQEWNKSRVQPRWRARECRVIDRKKQRGNMWYKHGTIVTCNAT